MEQVFPAPSCGHGVADELHGATFSPIERLRAVEDSDAPTREIQQHIPLLRATIAPYKPLIRAADAADIEQASVVGFLEARVRFDATHGSTVGGFAKKYVLGAVHRAVNDRHEAQAAITSLDAEPWLTDDRSAEDPERPDEAVVEALYRAQAGPAVRRFMDALSERQRHVVRRVYWDGLTQADVARELNVSRAAVTQMMNTVYARGRVALASLAPCATVGAA